MANRWRQRPAGSNWGDFGDDDQFGSLNYITEQCVLDAVQSVKFGKRFCLSLPLDYPGGNILAPHRNPPVFTSNIRRGKPYFNYSFRNEGAHYRDVGCDDQVTISTQYSTQWDSFAHIGHEFDLMGDGVPRQCFYNGYLAGEHIVPPEGRETDMVMPLGIESFAARPIQGRGVMIDIDRHYGREKQDLRLDAILSIIDTDGIVIRSGDILCFHTGFADEILKMKKKPDPNRLHSICAALDGRDEDLLAWISELRIAAIAADNFAVERVGLATANEGHAFVPLHFHCLFKRGIPLGELWHLTDLAGWLRAANRTSFLLTAPPLRLPGAVGSPVTPVATV